MRILSRFRWKLFTGLLIVTGPCLPTLLGQTLTTATRTQGDMPFIPLFSNENLKQWRQCGPGRFVMTNGIATGQGGMGLWWFAGRQFTNFVLRGEFVQEQEIADSGVFLRFPDPGKDPWVAVHKGHEMEIGDPAPKDPTWRTGSIYPFQASVKAALGFRGVPVRPDVRAPLQPLAPGDGERLRTELERLLGAGSLV